MHSSERRTTKPFKHIIIIISILLPYCRRLLMYWLRLTLSPAGVCVHHSIDQSHVFKPFPLTVSDFLWISALVSTKQFYVQDHIARQNKLRRQKYPIVNKRVQLNRKLMQSVVIQMGKHKVSRHHAQWTLWFRLSR